MKVTSTNSQTLARDAVPPITLPREKTLLDMLYYMKLTREFEFRIERKLYRQGKIVGGVYVGRGQEAIAVGSCIDLRQDDVVCPSHRDMGAFLMRGMPLRTILAQYMARKTGATRGKEGNMHMGDLSKNLVAFVSMLGDNVPVAAGVGLSMKMPGEIVDGNDILAVWESATRAIERARSGQGPTLIECKTFRMTGHSAHDDAGYVPPELFEYWEERDPIHRFEHFLTDRGLISTSG